MAFRDSIDAFMHAVNSNGAGGNGNKMLQVRCSLGSMWNGVKHCSVQVYSGPRGYCIDAYGEEAHELYRVASCYATAPPGAPRAAAA